MTTYSEVGAGDRDVAIFLVKHLHTISIWRLPLKAWVARQCVDIDGVASSDSIVAVMVFTNIAYPAIHVIVSDRHPRPFMRIVKLWLLAHDWFRDQGFPIIAAPVFQHLHHFRHLLTKLGFTKIGEESDDNGNVLETIYGYDFTKERASENPLHPTI